MSAVAPVARDEHGRELHLHDRVIAREPGPFASCVADAHIGALTYPGDVTRLHRTHGQTLAGVHLDTGSNIELPTCELARPCHRCAGEGTIGVPHNGRVNSRDPADWDGQDCPDCQGSGVEGER